MQLVYLIRHAESASNAGLPTESPAANPITDAGKAQAERLAHLWGDPPQLIVTSPYVRTAMTAAPLRARFPNVRHEQWPVQEWTQLCPGRYRGTTHLERHPQVQAYYERNDPDFNDGDGAESFVGLFQRVEKMLFRVTKSAERSIAVFTHGHFMRAVVWSILMDPQPRGREEMRRFVQFTEAFSIPNVSTLKIRLTDDHEWAVGRLWALSPSQLRVT